MTQKTERAQPVRSCIGCRTRHPQSALVRMTRTSKGIAVDGPSSGRGAWVCRNRTDHGVDAVLIERDCFDTAVAKRAFARAWRGEVSAAEISVMRQDIGLDRADREDTDTM